jgi:hypothetical protein
MPNGTTTYSFKDLTGAIVSVLAGPFTLVGGKVGAGKIAVTNTTTRSEQDTAADGAVMVSYVSGSAGDVTLECQQTSAIHHYLLDAANQHMAAADADDVSNWASTVINLRNILDGSEHLLTGVSFTKIPPKAYDARGGMITWNLLAANVVNL